MKETFPLVATQDANSSSLVLRSSRRLSDLSLNIIPEDCRDDDNEDDPTMCAKTGDMIKPMHDEAPPLVPTSLPQQQEEQEEPTTRARARNNKTVRFDETQNMYQESNLCLGNDLDCRLLWYTTKQLEGLRHESREVHRMLYALDQAATPSTASWCSILRRAYFSKSKILNDKIPLRVMALGMEKCVVPAVVAHAQHAHARQLEFIQQWQETALLDEDFRAEMMARACRSASRPCVLFASHLGRMVADEK